MKNTLLALFAVAASASLAAALLVINTPNEPVECVPTLLTWSGGQRESPLSFCTPTPRTPLHTAPFTLVRRPPSSSASDNVASSPAGLRAYSSSRSPTRTARPSRRSRASPAPRSAGPRTSQPARASGSASATPPARSRRRRRSPSCAARVRALRLRVQRGS
ncbi:hypothetical protein PsYK624_117020 [Phanerochaete sordida]|uniref:Uncharacterized protein n=1 Tax=Phanerochaete sordida TaxID=48140 RepID=A0A9P3LIT7_9APHY|nr:hypothetical protein PsYK624_117020 [Phanerochaete sordida]